MSTSAVIAQPVPDEQPRLLVVDDDDAVRDLLVDAFGIEGYGARGATSLEGARRHLRSEKCDAILLDINLPDGSGYELLRELRAGFLRSDGRSLSSLPVLMVSGRAGEHDRVRGFEWGCDDYVTKPFSFGELRGRVAAVLRRQSRESLDAVIDLGELSIDLRRRRVELLGRRIDLTNKEYQLLLALASDPERVFERQRLLEDIWGYVPGSATRTLDAHACRLRFKLKGGTRGYVHNCWGVGYRLCMPRGET